MALRSLSVKKKPELAENSEGEQSLLPPPVSLLARHIIGITRAQLLVREHWCLLIELLDDNADGVAEKYVHDELVKAMEAMYVYLRQILATEPLTDADYERRLQRKELDAWPLDQLTEIQRMCERAMKTTR